MADRNRDRSSVRGTKERSDGAFCCSPWHYGRAQILAPRSSRRSDTKFFSANGDVSRLPSLVEIQSYIWGFVGGGLMACSLFTAPPTGLGGVLSPRVWWVNEIGRKPANAVAKLESARQHQKPCRPSWSAQRRANRLAFGARRAAPGRYACLAPGCSLVVSFEPEVFYGATHPKIGRSLCMCVRAHFGNGVARRFGRRPAVSWCTWHHICHCHITIYLLFAFFDP